MDLTCRENVHFSQNDKESVGPVLAACDPVLLRDPRVWRNLEVLEQSCTISGSYFGTVQKEVQPRMRKILTMWMLKVCEDQRCEHEVFLLAAQFVDRYMAQYPMDVSNLQLLGAVCIFLASKIRDTSPLSATKLCLYSDNTFSIMELLEWEIEIVSRLNWDLASVLPSDYLDPLHHSLPIIPHDISALLRHTHSYIALSATEFTFSTYRPSVIACSCIAAAIQHLNLLDGGLSCETLLQLMASTLDSDLVSLCNCYTALEEILTTNLPLDLCVSSAREVSKSPVDFEGVRVSPQTFTHL
ncbi:G1/S-specific cyclin-D3 [Silurus meridionalis]|uniref:Cyclin D3 n=1 Tax=Silurus meridionalis TaxID=175797 RepID=A0A8T0AF69_SILME|nr:G1/S-specific cyclin-D3 [Silurus meridionalis]KAF7690069.1 hypothetical protein HF521_011873 [Silurus meridionalis]